MVAFHHRRNEFLSDVAEPRGADTTSPTAFLVRWVAFRVQPIAAVMGLFVPGFFGLDPASVELVQQRRDVTVLPDDSVYGNEAAQGV